MRPWVYLLLVPIQSCSGKHNASPPLADCGDSVCSPFTGGSQQNTGGGGNPDVDAGFGISLAVDAVAFLGSSSDTRAWSLSNVKSVSESVDVQALSASGSILTNSGPSPVMLSTVATGVYAWASAKPTTKNSIYLPGIVSIANWSTEQLDIPLLLRDDFSFVSGLYTTTTLSLDLTKAQVAVKVVDAQGNGVKSARIANPGGDTLAYANQGTWVDASLEPFTDTSGRVVVINVPAPTLPGGLITVTAYGNNLAGAQITATVALPIEAGFVSYGTVLLNLG